MSSDIEHEKLETRLRDVEETAAGLSKVVTGNGDPESGLTAQVRLVRSRTHDLANAVQAVDGKILLAVKDREHALERIREELRRHEEECMTRADVMEVANTAAKRAVSEERGRVKDKVLIRVILPLLIALIPAGAGIWAAKIAAQAAALVQAAAKAVAP